MEYIDGEEIWGFGDWWQRRINKKRKVDKQQISQKIYRVQIVPDTLGENLVIAYYFGIVYIPGILLVKLIWGSWFFGLLWPILLPFWILVKFI